MSQLDEGGAFGFGLFIREDGSIGFYTGDGARFSIEQLHTTAPGQIKMQKNPQGLKIQFDNTPSSVLENQWHHVVARADRESKQVWVVLSMPLFGWCVAQRGENFMYAKFHREMPGAKKEAQECAKRLNEAARKSKARG